MEFNSDIKLKYHALIKQIINTPTKVSDIVDHFHQNVTPYYCGGTGYISQIIESKYGIPNSSESEILYNKIMMIDSIKLTKQEQLELEQYCLTKYDNVIIALESNSNKIMTEV